MAGTELDDGDLIDLGIRGVCISRRRSQGSPLSFEEGIEEEHEHLLDVCPPKLEEKLSLSEGGKEDPSVVSISEDHEQDQDLGSDVLVTLGHDKFVPAAKRIDVVSSDTIKRVKDITKNLELSAEDTIDGISVEDLEDQDTSFEAREITNAFNFLAELEDEDDEDGNFNESISSEGPLMAEEFLRSANCPLEPTSFPGENNFGQDTFETSNSVQVGGNSGPENDAEVLIRRTSRGSGDFENLGFEASPPSNTSGKPRSASVAFEFGYVIPKPRCLVKSHSLRTSLGLSSRKSGPDNLEMVLRNGTRNGKRPLNNQNRKSWTEGAAGRKFSDSTGLRTQRSTSLGLDPLDLPSTSRGSSGLQRSDSSLRSRRTEEGGDDARSVTSSSSSSSSSASEVDWSWVEEVESSRSAKARRVAEAEKYDDDEASIGGGLEGEVWVSIPHSTAATPHYAAAASLERTRPAGNAARGSVGSTVMSAVPAAKPPSVPGVGPAPPPPPAAPGGPTSWVRASMRRLRHLRLPEAAELRPGPSGPNSLPDIALVAPDVLAAQTNAASASLRPASAPTPRLVGPNSAAPGRGGLPGGRSRGRAGNPARRDSLQSGATASDTSCSTSSATSTVTSPASSPAGTPQHAGSVRRVCERQRGADRDDERGEDDDENESPLGRWPHALSPALACLGCTLGLFNISRFAILSIQFGANFIVQFLVLSLVLGIPLFTLQVCLGQRLAAGAVDMWKISPLFQGVGIALLTAQAFIGIYSIVGVSWMFVYFRDSFITKQDRYRWAEPFLLYRDDTKPTHNTTPYKLHETVPDYFSGAVLQRHHLNEPDNGVVTLKFQVAFNLAVVWMIVFVSLSKGLRSYGKVVYVFTLVPVFGTLVLCAKLLGLTPTGSIHQLFPETDWSEFFINGKSWMAASTEVFLTWGLFGAAAMQIAAHNKHKHLLQRDTSLVVVLTFVVLLLSAFLANTCVQILRHHKYIYTTSSFESISGYTFMHLANQPAHRGQLSPPERYMNHASFLAGQRVIRHGANLSAESGYQVLRLATELVPATLALLGSEQVSPFWAVLFYFILILFGIAQQLAIWHCVITGIMAINAKTMKLWETTITFFSCACGYILGLPMATEFGIYVVYYLDYTVGGAWWIMVLYLVEVGAVFAVRGRPHTGEAVVAELFPPSGRCLRHWAGPLLSFTWNVVLPVALMVLSIMIFKSSGFRDLYTYRRTSKDYWAVWTRQLGAAIQLIPILMIPIVAIIQTCRYLNSGPPDILDNEQVEVNRIQLLYRPSLEPEDAADAQTQVGNETTTSLHGNGVLPSTTDVPFEDPPPKYTPPPSYTTATGARIAKMLRQSFRRSVRRIANVLGESSTPRSRPALQPPPPDYATVLVEMNQGIPSRDISIIVTEAGPDVTDTGNGRHNALDRHRPNTIDRTMRISTIDRTASERNHSTMDRSRRSQPSNGSSNLTAADVANLLRSSIRRGASRNNQSLHRSFASNAPTAAVSIENLVEAAAPIGQDSLVLPKDESLVLERDGNDDKKTVNETENTATVI
ncbi:sodium-dependent transporter bedraggled isoform X4 [Diprion similis]|uniref:sodium-dependent transporter bedraggled isoform X4 n=1 Tax=Diprion similis TaxID=362088 RepID=UPI001EF8EB2A|nr:sodium-dependent transporter bedraggled isoform X4 [Diprion similis]